MIFINSENKINSRLFSAICGHISKVINGHRPANLKDCRNTSDNDGKKEKHQIKGLDVVRQYAVLFERRVQSSTRVKKVQVVTRQTNPTGRSMIEMLGVLAIIGVLSVGGIAGYSKAMTKFKTNQIADQVATIVTNIKTLYAQQKNYNGLITASAVSMGIIPDELGTDYRYLTNPFNGNVDIFSSDSTVSMDNKAFMIFYDNLPKEACVDLVTNNWGDLSSGLIAVVAVGESSGSYRYVNLDNQYIGCSGDASSGMVFGIKGLIACPGGSDVSVPLSPSYASQACQCDKGNTCSVGWKYY